VHGLRVLIVDDNATNRMILEGWVRGWGMKSTATADGAAAMSALWQGLASNEPFSLLLLDARMPGTDGLELAKVIREAPALNACRIILLTSEDRPGDTARHRALRITAVLMKPIQQEELLDNIYRVLSQGAAVFPAAEPQRATPADAEGKPASEPAPLRRLNVLVAEDNKFNQQVIQRMLERRGHTVRVAQDGKETLAALERDAFDLLLLDVTMPEMDGFEAIKTIRENEKTTGKHLTVIALTALSGKRDRERCVEAGMDDYLAKPVRAAEVYAMLERVTLAQPVSEPEARAAHLGIIDPTALLSACGGDATLLADLIQLFNDEVPGLLSRVEAAVRSSDAEKLRMAAHGLRGLVSTFSTSVAKTAESLEQMGIDRRADTAGETFGLLSQAVQELRSALATLTIAKLHDLT
jgi:CheY-like chemotaxis protein